ncbi:DUF1294 domain-containing protein [Thermoclostridium stercorarium]|nr:DUF1294 domain-containing protein [Thermoclostridium stercorarium]
MDKYKAVHKKWRISENSFMLLAALGGGLGVYMGCLVFNHKVRSIKFMIGIPAIFIAETAILLLFL